jgi:hypothetical protein
MLPTPEEFRQRLLIDVQLLRENNDALWEIAQRLPLGDLKTSLEFVHQSSAQVTVNLKKTLMEMA